MASDTLARMKALAAEGRVRISAHGYVLVEDYPEFRKGPSVLVLQRDAVGRPVHVVWGIPKSGAERPLW